MIPTTPPVLRASAHRITLRSGRWSRRLTPRLTCLSNEAEEDAELTRHDRADTLYFSKEQTAIMATAPEVSLDIAYLNGQFETAPPATILGWAWNELGPTVAATSSFQTQSLPLLHMIGTTVPEMPVLFLDTGFHFPETLAYRDRLAEHFGLNVRSITPALGHDEFRRRHGDLFRTNPDLCCYVNKVEPLRLAKRELTAWVTGIRRDQTEARRTTPIIAEEDGGRFKICPMATWTQADVADYIQKHDLPVHPLLSQGYRSIGCAPCTRPASPGGDERSGRWADSQKTECGLHLDYNADPSIINSRKKEP